MASFFKPYANKNQSFANSLIQLSTWYNQQLASQEQEDINTSTADLRAILNIGANVDTPAEAMTYMNITEDALDDAPPEFKDVYKMANYDAREKKQLISDVGKLDATLQDFNKRWLNLSSTVVGEFTIDDVRDLKKEFNGIYDTYRNALNTFGEKTGLLSTSIRERVGITLESVDGAMGDLLITEKITPDDWEILQNRPQDLKGIRVARTNTFTQVYEKNTDLYNKIVNYPDLTTDLESKALAGNQEGIAQLLIPLLRDPITQELDAGVLRESTATIMNMKKFGAEKVITDLKNQTLQGIKFSSEQINFWSGKDYEELTTGIKQTDEQKKNKIFSNLSQNIPVYIDTKFLNQQGQFIDTHGTVHNVNKLASGQYQLTAPSLGVVKKGTIDKPTDDSLLAAKSLPDLAWYLWSNTPKGMAGFNINDKASKLLEEKGLDVNLGTYGYGGDDYTRTNTFMKTLKLLDEALLDNKATTISFIHKTTGDKIDVYRGAVWAGPKTEDDIKFLSMIARDAKAIIVNGKHLQPLTNTAGRNMFGELEEILQR